MTGGLPFAMLMLAQAAATYPQAPAPTAPPVAARPQKDECAEPSTDTREILVCAQRPQGYRLNPDVMEAKRELRSGGQPKRPPGTTVIPDSPAVGPFAGYGTAAVNLLAVGLTAAQMAKRLAEGKEIGSMFKTDPHPSEYQLYQMAKARREAREQAEAEARAAAKGKAVAGQAAKGETQAPSGAVPEPAHP